MECFKIEVEPKFGHEYNYAYDAEGPVVSQKQRLLYDLRKLLIKLSPGDPCMKHVVKQAKIKVDQVQVVKRKESDARFTSSTP
ncbi:hypothetical protein SARC_15139, partial [Sphaeroforma arctica JP610]